MAVRSAPASGSSLPETIRIGTVAGARGTPRPLGRGAVVVGLSWIAPRASAHAGALNESSQHFLIEGGRDGASELSAVVVCRHRRDLEAVAVRALGQADCSGSGSADQHGADLPDSVRWDQT